MKLQFHSVHFNADPKLTEFIEQLEVPVEIKEEMKALTPFTYLGK